MIIFKALQSLEYFYMNSRTPVYTQATQLHAHQQHAEQCSRHHIITLSGSGSCRIRRRISGHIQFRPDLKNLNLVHPY